VDVVYKNRFIWDADKAAGNPVKHDGITFEQAADAFDDVFDVEEFDAKNSLTEDRYNKTVLSNRGVLTISYIIRDDMVRIFSARKSDSTEKKEYYEHLQTCYITR
jgi:uncharacterized DUF497 family protein